MMSASDMDQTPVQNLQGQYSRIARQYQQLLDRWTPHTLQRWLATAGLLAVFLLRIVLSQGWYIVCYAHAIYLLNLLLAFLQPKFDPSLQEDLLADDAEEGTGGDSSPLPSARDDEFRPFVRRLPEWQFWCAISLKSLSSCISIRVAVISRLSATRATVIALLCTVSEVFDVPVYWPILVVYFFVLFALTMRRQIQCVRFRFPHLPPTFLPSTCAYLLHRHMIKYKYVPFDIGRKTRYGSLFCLIGLGGACIELTPASPWVLFHLYLPFPSSWRRSLLWSNLGELFSIIPLRT
ncbi:Rer1 family-domain-containing protein [Mycena crocata]|nr:Rer1 family-domain-containing protein [Mycena crocata]